MTGSMFGRQQIWWIQFTLKIHIFCDLFEYWLYTCEDAALNINRNHLSRYSVILSSWSLALISVFGVAVGNAGPRQRLSRS